MFGASADQLTWNVVSKWSSKDYDYEHSAHIIHQPASVMLSMLGRGATIPDGKPYPAKLFYFLKGKELLIFFREIGSKTGENDTVAIHRLEELSTFTQPYFGTKKNWFSSLYDKALFIGEEFFYKITEGFTGVTPSSPYQTAFILRTSKSMDKYDCANYQKFASVLKERISKSRNHLP